MGCNTKKGGEIGRIVVVTRKKIKKRENKMRNWREYNQKLINKARVEIYFSEGIIANWYNLDKNINNRSRIYSPV